MLVLLAAFGETLNNVWFYLKRDYTAPFDNRDWNIQRIKFILSLIQAALFPFDPHKMSVRRPVPSDLFISRLK